MWSHRESNWTKLIGQRNRTKYRTDPESLKTGEEVQPRALELPRGDRYWVASALSVL